MRSCAQQANAAPRPEIWRDSHGSPPLSPGARAGRDAECVSPQCLRDPARPESGAASDCSPDQSEARSGEAVRVRRDEGAAASTPVRESQALLQGGVGGGEIWGAAVAGAL